MLCQHPSRHMCINSRRPCNHSLVLKNPAGLESGIMRFAFILVKCKYRNRQYHNILFIVSKVVIDPPIGLFDGSFFAYLGPTLALRLQFWTDKRSEYYCMQVPRLMQA